jgi:hypothetical protein
VISQTDSQVMNVASETIDGHKDLPVNTTKQFH